MNELIITVSLMCQMTLAEYTEIELNSFDCSLSDLSQCEGFGYGKPGDENYFPNEKGLDIFIGDTRLEYEKECK